MADGPITGLNEATTLSDDDLFVVVDSPGTGAKETKKITTANVRTAIGSGGMTAATGTDANTTMAANTDYTVDMSGWATADRTYTLPAAPSVGNRVGIKIAVGSATFELIYQANTGHTIDGVSGERSRLFITGERVVFEYVATNKWITENDSRKPQNVVMRLSTSASGEGVNTITTPTDASGAWTVEGSDPGSNAVTASSDIKVRRPGKYRFLLKGASTSNIADAQYFGLFAYKNGNTTSVDSSHELHGLAQAGRSALPLEIPLVADDFIRYRWRSSEGSKGLAAATSPALNTSFSMSEVLT